jgi:ABC-type amino acid transport substrate-binding protein
MILNFLTNKKNIALVMAVVLPIIFAIIFIMFVPISCNIINDRENEYITDSSTGRDDILIVGSDTDYPPFVFVKDGNPVGFDIDLAEEIAKRMGKEIEIVPIPWDCNFKELNNDEIDMEISAIPITEEYEKIVDFSGPYFLLEYLLISLSGAEVKIKEDLEGKAVGILEIEKENLDNDCLLNYEVYTYGSVIEMFDDLQNKKIEGVLISLPQGVNKLKDNRELYIVLNMIKTNKEFGIVFKKGNILKEEVDGILEEIKEDGTYDEIYSEWFGL